MSRKELTDEQKQSEGDPILKQQRRQKAIAFAMNKMIQDIPNADVIIVNPTHYAIALAWKRGSRHAPICVAKGMNEIAAKIREIGMENNIHIHSDPATARDIYSSVEIGDQIKRSHYQAVAAAIRFADTMRKRMVSL